MDQADVYEMAKLAIEDTEAKKKPHAFAMPIEPFLAERKCAGEVMEALVVGLHYNPTDEVYEFISIVDDGTGMIYAIVDEDLMATHGIPRVGHAAAVIGHVEEGSPVVAHAVYS